jgi:hypothetical protein
LIPLSTGTWYSARHIAVLFAVIANVYMNNLEILLTGLVAKARILVFSSFGPCKYPKKHRRNIMTISQSGRVRITLLGLVALIALAVCLTTIPATTQAKSSNVPTEVKCPELGKIAEPDKTNCPECLKDVAPKDGRPVENPNSPAYYHIDKNNAYHLPATPAGDHGHLLEVDLTAPGLIISVEQDCHGNVCPWIHGCTAGWCSGHNVPMEYHGNNTAIWWGFTNSADNAELVFIVHYQ